MKIFTELVDRGPSQEGSVVEQVKLSFDDRKRARLKVASESANEVGIQIERGKVMRHGHWLTNAAGEFLQVIALPEKVSTARVEDSLLFARSCYHLGNRHVSLQIGEGFLRYQRDYVLDEMLAQLGVKVEHELAEFEPENGAYAKGHSHSHSDGHSHDDGASNHHHHNH